MHLPIPSIETDQASVLVNEHGTSCVLLVCEHASNHIPVRYDTLGLNDAEKISHAAWDIGAKGLSEKLSELLDAKLVLSTVSRLVYDCNRPPSAHDAMPSKSEVIEIPANVGLSDDAKQERINTVYKPFEKRLSDTIKSYPVAPILVTIHSFTPLYYGKPRDIEIGLIHDADQTLIAKMMALAPAHTDYKLSLNEPYAKDDGVVHTLDFHGTSNGLINVMVEVRNDLIKTPSQQEKVAQYLTQLLRQSLLDMNIPLTIGNMP